MNGLLAVPRVFFGERGINRVREASNKELSTKQKDPARQYVEAWQGRLSLSGRDADEPKNWMQADGHFACSYLNINDRSCSKLTGA